MAKMDRADEGHAKQCTKGMMAAKTPEERQALMDEHMKLMQDGMGMMRRWAQAWGIGGMQGGKTYLPTWPSHRMMEKRMQMMESMMQMMLDRLPASMTKYFIHRTRSP